MHLRSVKHMTATVLMVLLAAAVGASAQQAPGQTTNQAPTIADIARQKRAEKAKKRRTYTTEDMKAAEAVAPAAEAPAPAAGAAPAGSVVQSNEALAAAQAKLEDLKGREAFYLRSITRFEKSATEAAEAGEEGKQRIMTEATEEARAELVKVADDRAKAEQDLEKLKAAQAAAAAAAAAPKKRPARKPAATAPKS